MRPPPWTVAIAGVGLRLTRQAEEGRRTWGEGRRSGRRCPGTSSPEPAAISVTAGSAAVASTEPEPPPFQNSRSATRASASEISRRRTSSWAIEACLRRRTSSDLVRWPGTSSGTPATWPS